MYWLREYKRCTPLFHEMGRSDEVNLVLPEIQAPVAVAGLFRWFFICGGQSGYANHLSPYD